MPVFVLLGNWTDQGIRKITEAPKRAKAAHDMVNKAGGKNAAFLHYEKVRLCCNC
jgi:uncharacterized protein with GYD domain